MLRHTRMLVVLAAALSTTLTGCGVVVSNSAETAVHGLVSDNSLGLVEVCHTGPSIDNDGYDGYYTVSDRPDLDEALAAAAARQGYRLTPDRKAARAASASYGKSADTEHTYLRGRTQDVDIHITVNRDNKATVYCEGDVSSYGAEQAAKAGQVTVQIQSEADR